MELDIGRPNGIKTFRVKIKGVKPLLMHSTRVMTESPKMPRGGHLPPKEEAELATYRNKKGELVIPGDSLLGAIKAAATDFKVKGKGKTTYKKFVDSGLEIGKDAVLTPQEYEIDSRPVVISRSRIIRSRPRFDEWEATFDVQVLDPDTWLDSFDEEYSGGGNLRDMIEAAGMFKGLCDFRPRFGRFKVESFNLVEGE